MARLTALLPAAQGVAAYAALARHADTATATGDSRGRGQLMADTLVARLTGQTTADQVPVEVELILDADTLLGKNDEPAELPGYGPIPAETARELTVQPERAWLRRLYRRPAENELVAMETRRRCFTAGQRQFIRLRDQTCRTPWCDAPIRHTDHITPADAGGATSIRNGQGLCAACNYAKQAPGWQATRAPNGDVQTETPTRHRYHSRAPAA
jgi:5-methylcytosine-specific restriction endonuclease McrA